MLNLDEFIQILDEATDTINEKIVSKKALRRKRRKLRKLKAQQTKQSQNTETSQETNIEQTQDTKPNKVTALVVYDENAGATADDEKVSEYYQEIMTQLNKYLTDNYNEVMKGQEMWKQAGEDRACPQDAWNVMYNAMNSLQQDVSQEINKIDQEKLTATELQSLDVFFTSVNGYIEKAQQQIMAIKPNLGEEDLDALEDGKTGTDLVVAQNTDVLDPNASTKDKKDKKKNNRRNKTKIVDYKTFMKGFDKTIKSLKGIMDKIGWLLKNIVSLGISALDLLRKIISGPAAFFGEKLWAFLTSPLAKDFVKILAYTNPLTKMLFDGDLGKFGIGNDLNKLRQWAQTKLKQIDTKYMPGDIVQKEPNNYDKRHLPKSKLRKNITLRDLKVEFYKNKSLCSLINTSYNHPDVKIDDKAILQTKSVAIPRAIKKKELIKGINDFNILVDTCRGICNYMDWESPVAWENIWTSWVKARGNTEEQQKQIQQAQKKNKNKPEEKTIEQQNADQIKYLQQKHPNASPQQLLDMLQGNPVQEAFIESFNELLDRAQR